VLVAGRLIGREDIVEAVVSPMMMTTCLIGVVVCMPAAVMAAGPGDAVAAAAVKAVVTIPSVATTPICLIIFRFIGLPSPSTFAQPRDQAGPVREASRATSTLRQVGSAGSGC
jgi:ABC-type nitrate/sulfonate/bicarbonate transport system permease component